jgi:probable addiction module antidote protein
MSKKTSRPFKISELSILQDQEQAALYLEDILQDGDIELFKAALQDVAKARVGSMVKLAQETDIARESLYQTLSKQGNPRFDTLNKVLDASGLRLSVVPR